VAEAAATVPVGKGGRTAARIRDVALEMFSRLGFERVMMAEIAAGAGVSQATLHYHFQDKAQLWRAAMLHLSALIGAEERRLEATADLSPVAQLREAMRLFLRISWKHPALGRIIALEGMAGGERLAWLDSHLTGPRNRRLVAIVREAIAAGELKPFPAEQLVITLQAAGVGVINLAPMIQQSFGIDPASPEARQAHETMILDALLGGLMIQPEQT
jgi:TetR/AcrR family transcriptional regulator